MALINIGLHPNGLHPCTSFKMYKSIVLPRAMYGCELWSNITQSRSVKLEQACARACVRAYVRVIFLFSFSVGYLFICISLQFGGTKVEIKPKGADKG